MKELTYWNLLKDSPNLIKEGTPDRFYWSKTWDEFKWMMNGIKSFLFQIFALLLWLCLIVTAPISLPILSFFSLIYRKKEIKKRKEDKRRDLKEYEERFFRNVNVGEKDK